MPFGHHALFLWAAMFKRIAPVGLLLALATPATAWNALGHKVIAEIAWRQITPQQQQTVVDTLRRHPRFDADFVGRMPDDVLSADKATQDQWVFQAAAYWPDVARGGPYDHPSWHFINRPVFVDQSDETLRFHRTFDESTGFPTPGHLDNINVAQAIAYARVIVRDKVVSQRSSRKAAEEK
jgi:hypothetical protein